MIVGLDYDGTVTSDPEAFWMIVQLLRQRGHKVYIVTMRYPSECTDIFLKWGNHVDGIYATGRQAKQAFMLERNIPIGIWIDDNPRAIHESATQIWGQASAEGTVIIEDHNQGMKPITGTVALQPPRAVQYNVLTLIRYSLLRLAVLFKSNYLDHHDGFSDPVHMFNKLQHNWWETNGLWFVNEVRAHQQLALKLEIDDADEGGRRIIVLPPALTVANEDHKRDADLIKNLRTSPVARFPDELIQRAPFLPNEIGEMLKELKKSA